MGKAGSIFKGIQWNDRENSAAGCVWHGVDSSASVLRPAVVRHALPERAEEVMCTADAVRIALEQDLVDEQDRNVILAHQFVTGAKRCDAEELQVGDLDQIPAELFENLIMLHWGTSTAHRRWKEIRFAIAVRR